MSESIATVLVTLLGLYAAVGFVFAFPFLILGVKHIDPDAAEGTRGFRLLIFPGVVAFWPLLMTRWARGVSAPPAQCDAHRRAAEEAGA